MSRTTNNVDLESALQDAACMADIAFTFMGRGLGFENREPPRLTERESNLVYWIVSQTAHMIRLAEEAFNSGQEAR